jgi:hypothetical protein
MFAADEVEEEFGDGGTAAFGAECTADPCAVAAVLVLSDVEDTVEPGMHLVIGQTRAIPFRNSFSGSIRKPYSGIRAFGP